MATLVDYNPARHEDALRALWVAYIEEMADSLREEAGLELDLPAVIGDMLAHLGELRPPIGRLLLAVDGGVLIGSGAVRVIAPGVGEVKRMYLHPTARGRGLGRALLDQVLATARGLGCREARLETAWFMTDAHRLYRAAGFEEGEPYPQSETPVWFDARWMYMTLDLTDRVAA